MLIPGPLTPGANSPYSKNQYDATPEQIKNGGKRITTEQKKTFNAPMASNPNSKHNPFGPATAKSQVIQSDQEQGFLSKLASSFVSWFASLFSCWGKPAASNETHRDDGKL